MIRMMPIAASIPLITDEGKKYAMMPARMAPRPSCSTPAMTTAVRNASHDPSVASAVATIAVSPAAGPLTMSCEPLISATTRPPITPEMSPAASGAPEASATPRQSGSATRNTTRPAAMSAFHVVAKRSSICGWMRTRGAPAGGVRFSRDGRTVLGLEAVVMQ